MSYRIWFNIIDSTPETSIKISTDVDIDLTPDTKLDKLVKIHKNFKAGYPSKIVNLDAIEKLS